MATKFPNALVGEELIEKIKETQNTSKTDLAAMCGYTITKPDGKSSVSLVAFQNAIIEAQGLNISKNGNKGPSGRRLRYESTVQSNGNLIVGSAYTKEMGLTPGSVLAITIDEDRISLIPRQDEEFTTPVVAENTVTATPQTSVTTPSF